MRTLQELTIYEKRAILRDWIDQMDECGLDDTLIEFCGYEDGEEALNEDE